ncbi:MAG: hypothetical protein ACREMX_18265 [Gemmatimonadales bacterium]
MTEPTGDARPSASSDGTGEELVVHKATRECPMIQPHRRAICGIVAARERNQAAADAERRRAATPELPKE